VLVWPCIQNVPGKNGELSPSGYSLHQWFLTGGARPPGGCQEISRGRKTLHATQHRIFLNGDVSLSNVTTVLLLRRYMLFGLVPAEMEVGVKYLEILLAEFEFTCKHSGAQLGGLFSRHAKPL